MCRLQTVSLALLAVLTLGAITAEAASAASTVLPEFSREVSGNGTSGTSSTNLEGTIVSCPSADTMVSATSKKSGTFKFLFGGCISGGESCHSLGQAVGSSTVEVTGEYHVVSRASDRTFYMTWLLFASTDGAGARHIECEGAGIGLVLEWGNILGRIRAEPSGSERTSQVLFRTEGGGKTIKQELETFGNNNGTEITVEGLKGKLGTGTARVTGVNSESNLLFSTEATSLEES
jgi:hypothetical protein